MTPDNVQAFVALITGPLGALVGAVALCWLFVAGRVVSGKVIDRLVAAGEKRDDADTKRNDLMESALRELAIVVREQRRG